MEIQARERQKGLQIGRMRERVYLEGAIKKAMDEIGPLQEKKVTTKKINQWSKPGIKVSTKLVKHGTLFKEDYKNYKRILQRVTCLVRAVALGHQRLGDRVVMCQSMVPTA